MKCKYCNSDLRKTSVFCPNCGAKVEDSSDVKEETKVEEEPKNEKVTQETVQSVQNEESVIGWGILGFFIPLVGLILFIIWNKERPKASKASGIGALIRVAITIIFYIFIFISIFSDLYKEKKYDNNSYNNHDNYNNYDYEYDYDWD